MLFEALELSGAALVKMERHVDERGFFARSVCVEEFRAHGLPAGFVQSSVAWNRRRGTVRGLHFQWPPSREGKLVRCLRGAIHDLLLDLRPAEPTYLRHRAVLLDEDNRDAVFVPAGVAHGFQTLADDCEVLYEMTDVHALALIRARVPLIVHEVPSGTRVFDWEIPLEWNVEDAAVIDADGRRVIDFQAHNLHLVGYSEPVQTSLSLAQLSARLHVLPEHPDWIPYRTSYYRRDWGFCMRARDRLALRAGRYRIEVKSSLAPGSLTYGELPIAGRTRAEVLVFTHVCHPSLANDNTSGMAVMTALAEWIAREPLGQRRHDRHAAGVVIPFSPYGYDERQLCSPGFDLPAGRLTRSVNGGYPQYHTSADDLSLITPAALQGSFETCQRIVELIEANQRYVNLKPKGEPRLGPRGLSRAL